MDKEDILALKALFADFFQHKKKLAALENFSYVDKFPHRTYLPLIKKCLTHGFLGEMESKFLQYMLDKYEVQYLDWSQRTNWLKREMYRRSQGKQNKREVQPVFDFISQMPTGQIPLEILRKMAHSPRQLAI